MNLLAAVGGGALGLDAGGHRAALAAGSVPGRFEQVRAPASRSWSSSTTPTRPTRSSACWRRRAASRRPARRRLRLRRRPRPRQAPDHGRDRRARLADRVGSPPTIRAPRARRSSTRSRRAWAGRRAAWRAGPTAGDAIARALRGRGPGDVVLIAGKGHETYQIVGTDETAFDDREIARDPRGAPLGSSRRLPNAQRRRRVRATQGALVGGPTSALWPTAYRSTPGRWARRGVLRDLRATRTATPSWPMPPVAARCLVVHTPGDDARRPTRTSCSYDTTRALGGWRRPSARSHPLVGITGSNGKTTTKG